jgi:hypothetical protein
MCTFASTRWLCAALISWVMACGGSELTLPGDGSPSLRAFSGAGQEGTVGTELPEPLVARLTDGSARPLAGVSLEFRFRNDVPEAKVEPSIVETNDSGFASVWVRLGSTVGSQTVEASLAENTGSDLRTSFGLTALEEMGDDGDGGGDRRGRSGEGHDHDDEDDEDDED